MELLKIIITVLMIVALLYAFKKNYNPTITLVLLGLIGIFVGAIINKTNPMEDAATGNLFVDVFKWFTNTGVLNSLAGAGVNISVFAYVYYMDRLKASTLFALIASKPIAKIKNKDFVSFAAFVLTGILLLVIPSGTGRIALLCGVLWPIMQVCGVSKATAVTAIFVGTMLNWGPTNTIIAMFDNYIGTKTPITPFFLNVSLPWDVASFIVVGVVFLLTSKYYDKKENAESAQAEYKDIDPNSLGIPKWYALLPLVPLVLVILFSGVIKGMPVMDIPQIEFMCFALVAVFIFVITKDKVQATNDAFAMFDGVGKATGSIVSLIIAGAVYGKAMTMIGGINVLVKPFMGSGTDINLKLFVAAMGLIGFVIGSIGCSFFIPFAVLGPMFYSTVGTAGGNVDAVFLVAAYAWLFCMALAPASPHIALASNGSGVPIKEIWKRALIPSCAGAILYIIAATIIV